MSPSATRLGQSLNSETEGEIERTGFLRTPDGNWEPDGHPGGRRRRDRPAKTRRDSPDLEFLFGARARLRENVGELFRGLLFGAGERGKSISLRGRAGFPEEDLRRAVERTEAIEAFRKSQFKFLVGKALV